MTTGCRSGSTEPLYFELAWTAARPVPADLRTTVAAGGARRTIECKVTLLDSPDHRLLRSGIVVAHRVVDGLGEWYMDAPEWSPWLPVARSVALDAAGELPQDFTCLVRPSCAGRPSARSRPCPGSVTRRSWRRSIAPNWPSSATTALPSSSQE